MRSHLEFRSSELLDPPSEEDLHGGERLASLLAEGLPAHGYTIKRVFQEDWGWCVQLENAAFPLWIGCGRYEEWPDGHLCFIDPSKPVIRRWLKRITTSETVEQLADGIEQVIRASGKAHDLRWWSPDEVTRG